MNMYKRTYMSKNSKLANYNSPKIYLPKWEIYLFVFALIVFALKKPWMLWNLMIWVWFMWYLYFYRLKVRPRPRCSSIDKMKVIKLGIFFHYYIQISTKLWWDVLIIPVTNISDYLTKKIILLIFCSHKFVI